MKQKEAVTGERGGRWEWCEQQQQNKTDQEKQAEGIEGNHKGRVNRHISELRHTCRLRVTVQTFEEIDMYSSWIQNGFWEMLPVCPDGVLVVSIQALLIGKEPLQTQNWSATAISEQS
ncbi:hypothetical protein XENOCAPTIV_009217 [Xenoophorus captivus]|uniref:Uncharacterized protein n=1 Tax=Xenoophorus captivus TaxID=1517983 RepID=A0ABV0QBR9_9TELE